ncbi:MAG: hypothetical protein R3176_01290 [Woeseiaceae bacterium]|nr:hypothetical protein [Woeseiaceae bacterium]
MPAAVAGLLLATVATAHGEGDWNDFKVDNKNEAVAQQLAHTRKIISDIVLARRPVTEWPDLELMRARDRLAHLAEEVDAMLDHFREDGITIQFTDSLHEHPRAGQSVAARHALETCIDLIDHMAALDGVEAFADELHEGGPAAYLFDLMDAYVDNMALYGRLVHHAH